MQQLGKLRQTALILSEDPTEFFYFKSLCDVYKRLTIKPDYPKHTNMKELDAKIIEGVAMGYNHIFGIIDMDNKDNDPERTQYKKLRANIPNQLISRRKVFIARSNFSKPIVVRNYSFYTISAILHAYIQNKTHC